MSDHDKDTEVQEAGPATVDPHDSAVAATQRLIQGAMADHVHTAMYYE